MATTINSYKVSLALDAHQYISASQLSRKETGQLVREINSARSPADNYTRSLNLLDKALKQGAIDQGVYNRLLDGAKLKFESATRSTQANASAVMSLASAMKAAVAAYVAMKAAGFAKDVIQDSVKLASETESAAIAFDVLTGSARTAADMLNELRILAATTPLTFGDTQAAARTMLSFSIEAHEILPTLKMLGDVTGGNSERFKMMTLAFSQMSAAGRMMGQDLLQMINAGFNPLQEISKQTGESMLELKKRMEEGGVSSREIAEAFKSATNEGGRFFGMIDRMADTTQGKFAKLIDQLDQIKRGIGEQIMPYLNYGAGKSTGLLEWLGSLDIGQRLDVGEGAIAAMAGDIWGARGNPFSSEGMSTPGYLAEFREQTFNPKLMSRVDPDYKPDWFDPNKISESVAKNFDMSHSIESMITSSIDAVGSMATTVTDGLSVFQQAASAIAMSGVANTQEIVQSMKEDPAIASLEVGTQEAYAYLTQATRDAEKAAREEAAKKAQLEENARKQRDKMNEYLDRISDTLQNNGFKRIR